MPRFLLPAAGMIAAFLVLIAGTFDDLPEWRRNLPVALPSFEHFTHSPTAPAAATPSATAVDPRPDDVRRQVQDLLAQVDQEARDLATLRATADQTRWELASLREQRQREQASVSPRQAVASQDAGAPPSAASPDAGAKAAEVASSGQDVARTTATAGAAAPGTATKAQKAAVEPNASPSRNPAPLRPLVVRRLNEARTAMTKGNDPRARWLLRLARNQIGTGPARANRQDSDANNPPRALVTNAIAMLDHGDSEGALRTINEMLAREDSAQPDSARQNYRAAQSPSRS
jgi:hypothetical protein